MIKNNLILDSKFMFRLMKSVKHLSMLFSADFAQMCANFSSLIKVILTLCARGALALCVTMAISPPRDRVEKRKVKYPDVIVEFSCMGDISAPNNCKLCLYNFIFFSIRLMMII